MLHPRLTPVGASVPVWLSTVGPYGTWTDLQTVTRWGSGACGMFEASWSMPLPPDFEHPLLRFGTLVELMDGPVRVGSPLILSEPARGASFSEPWRLVANGIGREVEGDGSFYALDGAGETTTIPSVAVGAAIGRGLRWDGYDSSVPTASIAAEDTSESLVTVGALLTEASDALGQRWGVGDDNMVRFLSDPTSPTWQVTPDVVALGVATDSYASAVLVRYLDDVTGSPATVSAPASPSAVETAYSRREYRADVTSLGPIPAATAQDFADGILAKSKGRLGWTNGFTLTSQELLTIGGVPADLGMVQAGQMVRMNGLADDLVSTSGQAWLDVTLGEAKHTDGAPTIDLSPLGLASRDMASVVEEIAGLAADAAA